MNFDIRAMREHDFDFILAIQGLCFSGDYPESKTSLFAKFQASPSTCFVAVDDADSVMAYLFSVPWTTENPPPLNDVDCRLPDSPDCLYLHDLSVHPIARGKKLGERLLRKALDRSLSQGLQQCCLVAVQGSLPYWRRFGFEVFHEASPTLANLRTYGEDARHMFLLLP